MRLQPRSVTLLAALVAGVLTDLVITVPSFHFAYRSVPLHAMLETTATVIALLTTILLWGRLQQRQRLDDLLLFVALAVLSLTSLLFATIPAGIWTDPHPFSTWTTVCGGAVAAALLAAAAIVPSVQLREHVRAARVAVAVMGVSLFAIGIVIALLVKRLPVGIDPSRNPVKLPGLLAGNGFIVGAQMVIAVLYVVAAVGFTRRAGRSGDELLLWLGAGSVFAAFARVNYFIFPSLYSEWVYSGDALRLGWHLLLFIGAAREIQLYQRVYADARVVEERRRIARDLHDGLAQELAFIASTAREPATSGDVNDRLRQVASAAERGLDESRRAIATLATRALEPFDVALVQSVEELAQRLGTHAVVQAEPAPAIEPYRQEQLLRIVREAVTNAVRHGNPELVRVSFSNGNGYRLRVEDDGVGFDPAKSGSSGFGLVTMRERASSMGGTFELQSSARGTQVDVIIP